MAAVFFLLSTLLFGQTAEELDFLLSVPELSYAQASRLILQAAGVLPENPGLDSSRLEAEAVTLALQNRWLPKKVSPDDTARLKGISLLIAGSFNIKGGLMNRIFHNSHFAYREMLQKKFIQGRADPSMTVSGARLLQIIGRVLSFVGEEELPLEEPPQDENDRLVAEIRQILEERQVAGTTVRRTGEGVTISMSNIRFKSDSPVLMEMEKSRVAEVVTILIAYPNRRVLVGGHAVPADGERRRLRLSAGRAQTVADFLVNLGARKRDQITVKGYGVKRPLGDNDTPEGQALNRRIEITLVDDAPKGGGNAK
jgi:outer membrane protein OmpA-like peptidoglycan-associated protein